MKLEVCTLFDNHRSIFDYIGDSFLKIELTIFKIIATPFSDHSDFYFRGDIFKFSIKASTLFHDRIFKISDHAHFLSTPSKLKLKLTITFYSKIS